jgi:hypothetical protein
VIEAKQLEEFKQIERMALFQETPDDIVEQLGYELYQLRDGRVLYEGYVVPFIRVNMVTDDRYPYWVEIGQTHYPIGDKSAVCQAISVAAHTAALTAGYTTFGKNLRPQDPRFNEQPHGLLTDYRVHQFTEIHGDPYAIPE